METERQESKILMEKMDFEVAERKLSFHNLQEEMRHLLEQLEQAGQAQAELQSRYSALEQKHKTEMEEKTSHILSLQKIEQELHSACDALKDENSKLLQEKSEQALHSAQAIQQLEGQYLIAFEAHLSRTWVLLLQNFRVNGIICSNQLNQ